MEGRGGRGAAATSGRGEREWVLGFREGRCLNTEACSWAGSAVEMGRGWNSWVGGGVGWK
jgi:hypothetical protein